MTHNTLAEHAVVTTMQQAKYDALTEALLQLPQVDLLTTHVIMGGLYARTIRIPAGVVLTGAVHKKDHVDIMQGDITVTTHEGSKRLTGHHVLNTPAGLGRAGYAHTETLWTTICATELTELAAIEAELVENPAKLQTRGPALCNLNTQQIEVTL